jgi:hypothetical protein
VIVPIARHYIGSGSMPSLTADAEAALDVLDEIVNASEATASIDENGGLSADIRMDGIHGLRIYVGDGWNSVHYSGGPTRTPFSWRWNSQTTPQELRALAAGRAVERVRRLGPRRLSATLVIEGRTVARYGRLRALAALVRLPEREHPVEPYVAPALGDEIFMHAPVHDGWPVVMRRNHPDRPIQWYLQHWNPDPSQLLSQSQPYPFEGQAVMSDLQQRGSWLNWRHGRPAPDLRD